MVSNPSFDDGWNELDPNIPDDWNNDSLDAGDLEKEIDIVHSGSNSAQFNTGADYEAINQSNKWTTNNAFYAFGGFGYTDGGNLKLSMKNGNDARYQASNSDALQSSGLTFTSGASWNHGAYVARSTSTSGDPSIFAFRDATGARYADDIYSFKLTDVTLTVTPATETNSTETSGLRIDGDDTATQTISELTTTSGTINFKYTPRHDAADAMKFLDDSGDDVYIAEFYGDADDYIKLYWNAADSITMVYNMNGGGEVTGSAWTTTGITASTTYEFILTYTGGGNMILDVDGGADEITHATIPAAFGTAPTSAYWGSSQAGENQADATFSEIATVYYGTGSSETSTTTDTSNWEDTNLYTVFPGTGSYQTGILGISDNGWFDQSGGTDDWYLDFNNSSTTRDRFHTRERNTTPTGKHYSKWQFLMLPQAGLDSENEREAYINDYRNPDDLSFSTGSEWSDKGPASPGLDFDGGGDYVRVSDDDTLTSSTLTFEAWVYVRSIPNSWGTIFTKDSYPDEYFFYIASSGQSGAYLDGFTCSGKNSASSISFNAWQHVALTWDGSDILHYINGSYDDTDSCTATLSNTALDLYIGTDGNGDYPFDGLIDEVRIWDDVRTAAEIRENMYKQINPSSANLVGYWRMNENTGTTTYDETTNNNDGTFSGDPEWTTGFVPDQYNESEGVYTVDTSNNQVQLDIDGGTYTRHNPFFKIRKYWDNNKPSSVTMEGVSLVEGTDYTVDFKPISDAYFADGLTWYSTMESSEAVTSPDVGTGTSVDCTFTTGKYGQGMLCDDTGEEAIFPMSGNVDAQTGTVEFWYQHTSDACNFGDAFFTADSGDSDFTLMRGPNDDELVIRIAGTNIHQWSSTTVNVFDGEWHHIRITYDTANDSYYLYLDRVSQGEKTTVCNDVPVTGNLLVGRWFHSSYSIEGVIDEFRVYNTVLGPENIAEGGNTADPDEYLFSETQDYTLDFENVDVSNRGKYLHLGSDSMFSGVNIDLETNGVSTGTLNLDWEYWNGTSWADLESISGFTDGTSNLTQDGAIYWDVSPTNWRPYSVNGSTDLYYIRASLNPSSDNYDITSPVENTIRPDILVLQYFSDITSDSQTLAIQSFAPTASASDLSGQNNIYAGKSLDISATYSDANEAYDLNRLYLRIQNPSGTDIEYYGVDGVDANGLTPTLVSGSEYITSITYDRDYASPTTNDTIITWHITFDWDWTENSDIEFGVRAIDDTLNDSGWDYTNNDYFYENNLDFTGVLSVTGAVNGTLTSGDWVQAGENINWTGLKVVYQNTLAEYPPDSDFDVRVSDDNGGTWDDTVSSGSAIDITSTSDASLDIEDIHNIDIIGIPTDGIDLSSQTFTIRVDDATPDIVDITGNYEGIWQNIDSGPIISWTDSASPSDDTFYITNDGTVPTSSNYQYTTTSPTYDLPDQGQGETTIKVKPLNGVDTYGTTYSFLIRYDSISPTNVFNLAATAISTSSIKLDWDNPSDSDFDHVTITRKTTGTPSDPTDGTIVYSGSSETYTDSELTQSTMYYYTVFAYDMVGNYSSGAAISKQTHAPIPQSTEEQTSAPTLPQEIITEDIKLVELPETGDSPDESPITITIDGKEVEFSSSLDLHVFANSTVETKIPVEAIAPDEEGVYITQVIIIVGDDVYVMQLNDAGEYYTAKFVIPQIKGAYDMNVVTTYSDESSKKIDLQVTVDPYGYIYTMMKDGKLKIQGRIQGAEVTLYTQVDGEKYIWDGGSTSNPQHTNQQGEYSFFVEPGKYKLLVKAPGYKDVKTDWFDVENRIIMKNIELDRSINYLGYVLIGVGIAAGPFFVRPLLRKKKLVSGC